MSLKMCVPSILFTLKDIYDLGIGEIGSLAGAIIEPSA
jgi:hypothetical protein